MARSKPNAVERYAYALLAIVLSVSVIYFGREILIPLALAVLLTFLLSPLVRALERYRLGRVPAVLLSVALVFAGLISVGGIIGWQLADLGARLPEYKTNLRTKLEGVRFSGGPIQKVEETFKDIEEAPPAKNAGVQPVRVIPEDTPFLSQAQAYAGSFFAPAATAGLVLVLVIFMLISREDMRNRLVRLAGKKLALTTRTLDEIGARISRYLLLNAMVNGGFGICVGLGLAAIGVQYAAVWGLLAALLRFIPYLGPIMAAALPILMALLQFPGHDWLHPLLAAGLFVVLELVTNNVVEPLVYGPSTGVSTVALLVAAMFWTWIWGPIGLLLAVPLTVILAVIGEHVRPLEPLAILLGDKPPLDPHVTYYQRLLAGDVDEAHDIFEQYVGSTSLAQGYDEVAIPALLLAEHDREREDLQPDDYDQLWQSTREFVEEMAATSSGTAESAELEAATETALLRARVIGWPAHDAADEIALSMLRQTLTLRGDAVFEILPAKMLISEMIATVENASPDIVCISEFGSATARQARFVCKRLRQSFPTLRLLVGQWGYDGDRAKLVASLKARGADQVVTTMSEALDALIRVQPIAAAAAESKPVPQPHLDLASPAVREGNVR